MKSVLRSFCWVAQAELADKISGRQTSKRLSLEAFQVGAFSGESFNCSLADDEH